MKYKADFHRWLEMGYPVFPVYGKDPDHGSFVGYTWAALTQRLPVENEIQFWNERGSYTGIGLVVGKVSGIMALDWDCFRSYPDLVSLVPDSPIVRVGRHPKWLRIYRYNEKLVNRTLSLFKNETGKTDKIELFVENKYFVAEGIHPETKKLYEYPEETLFDISKERLPEFPVSAWEDIERVAMFYKQDSDAGDQGRHTELVSLCGALISRGISDAEDVVPVLLDLDSKFPQGSYFKTHRNTPEKMFSSVLKTHNRNMRFREQAFEKEKKEIRAIEVSKKNEMPPITGWMKEFVDYLNKFAVSENSEVYLGAALAWLSMLVSSRYCVQTRAFKTPCNLMLWGVLPSGIGKDAPQSLLQRLFYKHKILGAVSYKSAPAFLMPLTNIFKEKKGKQELIKKAQRENLVVIDECSSLFRLAIEGENYQKDIIEILNILFSRSSGFFAGDQSVNRGAGYGAAFNPYFTLAGFTTVENFSAIKGSKVVGNGFFERSLVFINKNKNAFNDSPVKDEALYQKLEAFTDRAMSRPIDLLNYGTDVLPENEILTEVVYEPFPMNDAAEQYLHQYRKKMYELKGDSLDEAFYNRFAEIAAKLSLLHAVSEESSFIGVPDVKWGVQTVEWCYSNSRAFFDSIKSGDEDVHKKVADKITAKLNTFTEKRATKRTLYQCVRFTPPKNMRKTAFLNELIEMGYLKIERVGRVDYVCSPSP